MVIKPVGENGMVDGNIESNNPNLVSHILITKSCLKFIMFLLFGKKGENEAPECKCNCFCLFKRTILFV